MTIPIIWHQPEISKSKAITAMICSAACWGLATVMSKGALELLPPISLLVAQLAASVAVLWLVVLATRQRILLDRSARIAALSGVLEPGLAYALGIGGLVMTTASNASLISTTEPLVVISLAFVFFKVRTSRRQLATVLVATVGVALVSFEQSDAKARIAGDALIAAATIFAALYVVITSRLVLRTPPLVLAVMQQTVGFVFAIAILAGAIALGFEHIKTWPDANGWLLIFGSGIVQYALAFWFYLVALRALPVSTAALFLALIPVFGVSGAAIFLGETLSLVQLFGSTLIVVAVLASTAIIRQ
ncbi:DMT family transporter [Ruegeria sp. MALMAid1280]|uniref:DMT family transporter n=1 Tax=Ruegeria sp. MALMAid1280 TaxID=3411634 RepID=UPI003BA0B619